MSDLTSPSRPETMAVRVGDEELSPYLNIAATDPISAIVKRKSLLLQDIEILTNSDEDGEQAVFCEEVTMN